MLSTKLTPKKRTFSHTNLSYVREEGNIQMNILEIRNQLSMGKSIYDLPLRVTFYARVSTEKTEQLNSLENQIAHYQAMINNNINWTYIEGYIDEGISGTSVKKRNQFKKMIEDAKTQKFDFIITKEISRFSRSTLDSIRYTQELLQYQVGVFFQNDNINTLDTDSEFRLVIMAAVAQDEVRKLSDRLKFGFRQSIKSGRVLGNNSLWGYDKKDGKLTINEEEATVVRTIFHLYVYRKLGVRKISQYLSEKGITSRNKTAFNMTTIKNIIKNPKYKGYYCGNKTKSVDYKQKKNITLDPKEWVIYKDESIPAIVDETLWEKANLQLKKRGEASYKKTSQEIRRYPYSGKIICKEHHLSFHHQTVHSKNGKKEVWQCRRYRSNGLKGCTAPQLHAEEINQILSEIFINLPFNREKVIHDLLLLLKNCQKKEQEESRLSELEKEINGLLSKKDKLLSLYLDQKVDLNSFTKQNQSLDLKLFEKKREQSLMQKNNSNKNYLEKNLKIIEEKIRKELSCSGQINDELMASVIDEILVGNVNDRQKISLTISLKTGQVISVLYQRCFLSYRNSYLRNITPT